MNLREIAQKYILVVDYNLTRVKDVKLMSAYAKERYGLETILVRPAPTEIDRTLAKHVFDLDPRAPDFIQKAVGALEPFRPNIVGVLPFSDNAVQTGALLGRTLGKAVDSPALADAAYSKIRYREREQEIKEYLLCQKVFVPKFKTISNPADLKIFWNECEQGFVLKPSCEGNNRGVIKIKSEKELDAAFEEVSLYKEGGLICEEFINFPEEFSFDGIGHLSFVTEKESVSARYPVEKGQIVPALAPYKQLVSIRRAGAAANLIVGQNIGPFHNEIKYDPDTNYSAVVEPNRRPAGMKIWHLAERVYGINFFKTWIDQVVTGKIPASLPEPRGIAAIRQLPAPKLGVLSYGTDDARIIFDLIKSHRRIRDITAAEEIEWFDFSITKQPNSLVAPVPKDNSDFIAEICAFSDNLETPIQVVLDEFEKVWLQVITPYIFHNSPKVFEEAI